MEKRIIHLVGIGGIGISSLAQLYIHQGHQVSGTNDNPSPETLDRIREQGVTVHIGASIGDVPKDVDAIVYSDAWLSMEPVFMDELRALGKPMYSYFEALGEATREGISIVVVGTHGKTSTTAMLAKLLIDAGKEPTVIAGSVLTEYGSNFVAGSPNLFVIEGCEYRRHFLQLHPDILVITNIELDHTDYYRNLEDVQDAFRSMVQRVPRDGVIVTNTVSLSITPVLYHAKAKIVPYQEATTPKLKVPGTFNVVNARAAKVAAFALDPDLHEADLNKSLTEFVGTWRRFEYKGKTKAGATVYDDYAHHPTAVKGTLKTAKAEFKDKRLVVVFHPHLYSRTKSFFQEFATALSVADKVILLPIYAAREEPDPTVSSEKLVEAVAAHGTLACYESGFDAVEKILEDMDDNTVIITMGAGDVYKIADALVAKGEK